MVKNILLSFMAAAVSVKCIPCFAVCEPWEQSAVFVGVFFPLLFFCYFCDECAEKWRSYVKRVLVLKQYISRLKRLEVDGHAGSKGKR